MNNFGGSLLAYLWFHRIISVAQTKALFLLPKAYLIPQNISSVIDIRGCSNFELLDVYIIHVLLELFPTAY